VGTHPILGLLAEGIYVGGGVILLIVIILLLWVLFFRR
jgi:hypothetical protein